MTARMGERVAIITGANTGIGKVTAAELAKQGGRIILACRSREKTEPVVAEIKQSSGNDAVEMLELDLGSLASVRRAAETFLARDLPLPLLINNAGIAGPRGLTADGFELAFGTNHLGHFLFTLLLIERIKASAPARIVNVSSIAHTRATGIDFEAVRQSTPSITGLPEYQVSKLANVLFTVELARRLEGSGVHTYAVHPGAVASDVWRRIPWPFRSLMKLFMLSNEEGALTTLYCATSPQVAKDSGRYYDRSSEAVMNPLAQDEQLARELWRRSEAWCSLETDKLLPRKSAGRSN
jgi:retinol dehydrogenase-12